MYKTNKIKTIMTFFIFALFTAIATQINAQNQVDVILFSPPETIEKGPRIGPGGGSSGWTVTGAGGGYFMPLGEIGAMLDSNYCGKICAYNNNIAEKAIGIGIELTYADLKDKENNGGIRYLPLIGYVTLTYSIFGMLEVQIKTGAGVTAMWAEIDNGIETDKKSTTDFTWSLGTAILKTLYDHYLVGMDFQYYYIFEKNAQTAQSVNFITGYRF